MKLISFGDERGRNSLKITHYHILSFDGNPLRSNCPENDGSREPLEKSKKLFSFVVLILFFLVSFDR